MARWRPIFRDARREHGPCRPRRLASAGPPDRSLWSEYPLATRRTITRPPWLRLKTSIRSSLGSGRAMVKLLVGVGCLQKTAGDRLDVARPADPQALAGPVHRLLHPADLGA